MSTLLPEWESLRCPVIGMVHLPALPGAPRYGGDRAAIAAAMLADARALADGGCHGILIENFGDAPFFPGRVPSHVVATMTALAAELRAAVDLPLGINVLRNDGHSALAIAAAVGARLIRVNVLTGARVTDQGIIAGIAHELLRERRDLGAEGIRILADVRVKHSAPLGERPLAAEVSDLVGRGLADGVIVTGGATGAATDPALLAAVRAAAAGTPVLVGSGVTAANVGDYGEADGLIVGSAFKRGGRVDPARVRAIVESVRG